MSYKKKLDKMFAFCHKVISACSGLIPKHYSIFLSVFLFVFFLIPFGRNISILEEISFKKDFLYQIASIIVHFFSKEL